MSSLIPLSGTTWTPIGPAPVVGTSQGGGGAPAASGRITGIAADPTNANTIYITAAGGGVWKTTNGGSTWTPLTDNQATLFMGAIAIAPSNNQVIYAGTGEANNSGDSYAGKGILKSTNGGQTWTLLGTSQFNGLTTAKIVVDPTNQNIVYASMCGFGANGVDQNTGVWKSTNGGQTWTNTTTSISTTDEFSDLVMDPGDSTHQTFYAAVGTFFGSAANGVYKTTDGGQTWSLVGSQLPSGTADGRITLAISATTNPVTLYASIADHTGALAAMMKSTDGGQTWTDLTSNVSGTNYLGVAPYTQGWYDMTLAVDPNNPKVVYAGGSDNGAGAEGNIESRDGGNTWFAINQDVAGNGPHSDSHAMTFDANGKLLEGDDGGIYRLVIPTLGTLLWADLNGNLQITQFTGIALDPTNANIAYGGSQDNGTEKFNNNLKWTQIVGGDGGYVRVDFSNPLTVYQEFPQGGGLDRSDDGGNTFSPVTPPIGASDNLSVFYNPYVMDPSNSSRLIYATDHLYETTNKGATWTVIGTPGTNGFNPGAAAVTALAISKTNPNTVYATAGGLVFVTTNDGASWTQYSVPQASDDFSDLLIDPKNSQIVYLVRGEYNGGANQGHVFKTTNGGQTWTDISGNLPDVPTWSIAMQSFPGGVNEIYVGTDTGVYSTLNGGAQWKVTKAGLPNAQVVSLEYNPTLNILAAGTHGRGMWEIQGDALLTITAGTPAAATEGQLTTFANLATFTDGAGADPVGNYSVTVAWGDGTTSPGTVALVGGTLTIGGAHTYIDEGTYTVTITLNDQDGATGKVTDSINVNDAPLTASAVPITVTEGAALTNVVVATFTDGNSLGTTADFSATITWGDGNSSPGTITFDAVNDRYVVAGTHTYRDEGSDSLQVAISDDGGSSATASETVPVSDAALLNSTGVPIRPTEGAPFSSIVATFSDANLLATLGDFTALVNYGDGSGFLPATVQTNGSAGQFAVVGAHTYAEEGSYPISVKISDKGGSTLSAATTATVSDAALSLVANNLSSVENQAIAPSTAIATLTDADASAPQSDYTVTINFGDGVHTAVPGTLTSLGGGRYSVTAGTTYADEGSYTITITAVDKGGSTVSANATATIGDAPLSATGQNVSAVEGAALSGVTVAQFSDGNTSAPASDFTATIDWGNGTVQTNAPVASLGGGQFAVSGTNTYALVGSYSIKVTITDKGGSTASSTSTATITDAPLTAGPSVTFQAVEGVPFQGTVGSFTDGNPLAVPSNFVASIDWGDGTQSLGLLTLVDGQPGVFNVASAQAHAYAEESAPGQSYTITITVVDLGGQNVSMTGSATVADAPITTTSVSALKLMEGTAFSGVVATFTDADAGAPQSDYTALVSWGDGSVDYGKITFDPLNNVYDVSGSHTFTSAGGDTIAITVNDVGGSRSSTLTTASVADAPVSASANPIAPVAGTMFQGSVAQIVDSNHVGSMADFSAIVDWGDGTRSAGSITQPGGPGTPILVSGSHSYTHAAASLPMRVLINDVGGATAAVSSPVHVLAPLTGRLDPTTDTGVSNTDGITSDNQPRFLGTAEPNGSVRLYAVPVGNSGAPINAGFASVNAQGQWSVTSSALPDGRYAVFAQMLDPNSSAIVQVVRLMPNPGVPVLTIDTSGPVVRSVVFNPGTQQLVISAADGLSGLNLASLANPANYQLGLAGRTSVQPFGVTGVSVAPGAGNVATITVTYNLGRRVRPGSYVVTIVAGGLTDLAGNMLVEHNLLTFPQTTNSPNPNYVAEIDVANNMTATSPFPYVPYLEKVVANRYAARIRGLGFRRP